MQMNATEWICIRDDRVRMTVDSGSEIIWQYEYNEEGKDAKKTLCLDGEPYFVMTFTYTDKGKIAAYEQAYCSEQSSLNGTAYRYEYTYGPDDQRTVKHTELLFGQVVNTTEYVEKFEYDPNDLEISMTKEAGEEILSSRNHKYHFRKLEVPAESVDLLCNVYDQTGIKYVLGGWGVSVEDTLSQEELSGVMTDALGEYW